MVGLTFIGRPILRWAHRSYSSCLEPKPVVCVNQLVVALPLAAIALDYAPDNPFIRRRPRGRVSQISNVALDGCLAMTPDSLRFSESHCGSPHLIGQCCVPTSMRCQLCVRLCTLSRSFRYEEMCFHHRFRAICHVRKNAESHRNFITRQTRVFPLRRADDEIGLDVEARAGFTGTFPARLPAR